MTNSKPAPIPNETIKQLRQQIADLEQALIDQRNEIVRHFNDFVQTCDGNFDRAFDRIKRLEATGLPQEPRAEQPVYLH